MTGRVQHQNLWAKTAARPLELPPLQDDISADLVVIGGGFTGCAAALSAAQKGLSVVLLEAETIGFGGSGRNVGLVNAGLWTPPDEVETILGTADGARLNERLAGAPNLVFSLIEKHKIECDAVRNGTLHCAHAPVGMKDLESRFNQQQVRNAPVELLTADSARLRTGSEAVHGALFDPRAGTIQPLMYCQGLASAAVEAGAMVFERSPVVSDQFSDGQWVVTTKTRR